MLKGFTVPKSPFGQAALTPPPPWHYAGDAVGVEFWTDGDKTAAILPNGLSRDPKSNGHAVMMFLDWQFTAQDDEYLEPARYQYREAFTLVDAMHRDEPVMWCPYIYVDNDAALARGWTQGVSQENGEYFSGALLCGLRPRRGADCVRQSIWREPRGAWPASRGSLCDLAQAGRERTVVPHPTHGLVAILSEISGRIPGQARGKRTDDVDHR
jgi:Acetoacetate decarboxylase (ADC)